MYLMIFCFYLILNLYLFVIRGFMVFCICNCIIYRFMIVSFSVVNIKVLVLVLILKIFCLVLCFSFLNILYFGNSFNVFRGICRR